MAVHRDDFTDRLRDCEQGVAKFNRWLGEKITGGVATMWCAYLFLAIALVSLPQALHDTFADGFKPLPIVTWLAQTCLQLVLLSVILYGQGLQSEKSDALAEATYRNSDDAEKLLGKVLADTRTILKRLEKP